MNKYPQGWKIDELFEPDKDLWDARHDEEERKATKRRKIERRKVRKANRKKKQDDK